MISFLSFLSPRWFEIHMSKYHGTSPASSSASSPESAASLASTSSTSPLTPESIVSLAASSTSTQLIPSEDCATSSNLDCAPLPQSTDADIAADMIMDQIAWGKLLSAQFGDEDSGAPLQQLPVPLVPELVADTFSTCNPLPHPLPAPPPPVPAYRSNPFTRRVPYQVEYEYVVPLSRYSRQSHALNAAPTDPSFQYFSF